MNHFTFTILFGLLCLLSVRAQSQEYTYADSWDQQGFILQKNQPDGVEINFSISRFALEDIVINGEAMKNINLPGNFLFNDAGCPNLPGNGKIIALPQGSTPLLEVIAIRTEVINNIDIAPAPRIPKDDESGPLEYWKEERIYSQDAPYPAEPVKVSSLMKIRGLDAVMLGITPFQYNPVSRQLTIYRDLKVRIRFQGGNGHFGDDRLRSRWWDPILEDAIFNYPALPKINYDLRYQKANTEDDGAEYLIITPDGASFVQYADSIKKFRTEQGILTLVKTLTQVGGNTTTAIESYINNAYSTWTIPPAAILLLGDYGTDINSTVISPIYNSYCASDNIYGDYDGDQLPDIVMARITANNLSQLQVMVSKFLNYERNPPTSASFYNHPITALGWQTERWFQICSETVGGFWKNALGKDPVRINAVYSGTPGSSWSTATNTSTVVSYFGTSGLGYIPDNPSTLGGWTGGTATGVNNAINAGAFMLQHRDHGGETGWGEPSYSSSNIDGLTNTDLTYVMSINCLTGKYNYSSEVFAEKFHRYTYNGQNSGALGIMAATEVSYSFVNDTYVWGLFDNMWPNFMPAYGTTPASRGILPAFGNAAGKIFLQQSSWPYNSGDKEVTYHLFHAHGDAFLTVYSEVPQPLTVSHSPVLYAGTTSFSVTANAGSLIALTVNGVIIGTATGTGSPVAVAITAQIPPSQVIVTVTKQNYFRYRSVVDVVPPSGPYVVYSANTVSDPAPGGNDNAAVDFAELDFLNLAVTNVGIDTAMNLNATLSSTDTYITLTDNTENYGNINPDQILTIPEGFSFNVANNIPDQHGISFTLSATSGTDTWTSNFSLIANAPVLNVGTLTIQDNCAACDYDGFLDPGETADLLFSYSNTGHSASPAVTGILTVVGGSSPYLTINSGSFAAGSIATGGTANAVFSVTADASTPLGTAVSLQLDLTGGAYTAQGTKQVVIGFVPTYCTPTYSSGTGYGDYISLVQLGNINNSTGASASPYYTYYSSMSADLYPGNSYTITLSPGTYSSGNYVAVWIDFNRNGTWDADEKLGTISISPTPATGTITFVVPSTATIGTTRMRVREVWNNSSFDACSSYSYGETEDYNINILSQNKNLNLSVLFEGLYNGSGTMRKAQNSAGDQYTGNTADQISIELHNAGNYATVAYAANNINLSTTGAANLTIPGTLSGSYYITIKHRNGIETTTASPVSFTGSSISCNFNSSAMAYGNNLKQTGDGYWVIYGGDVNQDGIVDSGDMIPVDNLSSSFGNGYLPEDANGDGLIDSGDMILIDNNATGFISRITP